MPGYPNQQDPSQQQPQGGGGGGLIPGLAGAAYGARKAYGAVGGVRGAMGGARGLLGRAASMARPALLNPVNLGATGINAAERVFGGGDQLDRMGYHDDSKWFSDTLHGTPYVGGLAGPVWDATIGNIMRGGETAGVRLAQGVTGKAPTPLPGSPAYKDHYSPTQGRPPASSGPQTHEDLMAQWAKDYSPEANARRDAAIPGSLSSALAGTPGGGFRSIPPTGEPIGAPATPWDARPQAAPSAAYMPQSPAGQQASLPAHDPLEGMLHRRLADSMDPAKRPIQSPGLSFSVAGPVDPSGMGGLGRMLGLGGPIDVPQQPIFQPSGPSPAEQQAQQFDSAMSGIMGLRQAAAHREIGLGQNAANMMQAQAEMAKAQALTEPALMEANAGMAPGEMAMRRMAHGAPSLAKFFSSQDEVTADQLRQAMAGHEGDPAYEQAVREIVRQRRAANQNWDAQQTTPGMFERGMAMFGYPENPRYAQNRPFLARYQ